MDKAWIKYTANLKTKKEIERDFDSYQVQEMKQKVSSFLSNLNVLEEPHNYTINIQ